MEGGDCEALEDGAVLPICIHSYDDGTEVAPTCNEAGGMLYTCTICGHELMDASIDALGHNYDENGVRFGRYA